MKNIVQNLTINGRGIDGVQGIRTRDRRMVGADESTELWRPRTDFFKKWANPASFGIYFWSLQANIITIFTTNISEKISIQYMVPGFEPTTFGT